MRRPIRLVPRAHTRRGNVRVTGPAVNARLYLDMRLRVTLALIALIASLTASDNAAQDRRPSPERRRALAMFARAYYPGRSGQIMIVPRERSVILSRLEPEVKFMHGSPWGYDTRIPLLFTGSPYVRNGVYRGAARQQDL